MAFDGLHLRFLTNFNLLPYRIPKNALVLGAMEVVGWVSMWERGPEDYLDLLLPIPSPLS